MIYRLVFILLLCFSSLNQAAETVLDIIKLKHRPAESIQKLVEPLLTPSERIIANSDSLILKTKPENTESIVQLIKKLDQPIRQFVIQVLQSHAQSADQLDIGLKGRLHYPPSAYLRGKYGDTQALSDSNNLQTLRVLESETAFIKTGERRPFYQIRFWPYAYGQNAYSIDTQWLDISTGFAVTPRLSGDKIQLTIRPWTHQLTNQQTIATRQAATTITVPAGKWVAIGEVRSSSNQQQQGFLQHSRNSQRDNSKLFIRVETSP
jgi:type II secretory pathway component GspD/PulD (secretin)